MAKEQDVLQPNPGGNSYDIWGGGEERGVWGGKNPQRDDSAYTGGWHKEGDLDVPNDPEAYRAALKWTPSGRQQDVDRYRQMGEAAAGRAGVQLNYGRSDHLSNVAGRGLAAGAEARGQQQEVAGVMRSAALGSEPSRAELLGRGLIDQSLKAQLAGAASARGGAEAQMAARRQVQQGAAGFQQQGMNQLAALRADEMERARSAWGQQVGQIRGQDYQGVGAATGLAQMEAQKAQAQGQLEAEQRRLNQAGQLAYEGMGWDTNNASLQAGIGKSQLEQSSYQFGRQMDMAERQMDAQQTAAMVSAGAGVAGSAIGHYSDMRAKQPAPLLLDVGRKPKAAAPSWLAQYMDQNATRRDNEQAREEHDDRMDEIRPEQDIARDDPYAGTTPGGIDREDPYGSGEVFYSDEKAKSKGDLTGRDVVPLSNTSEGQLKWGDRGAFYEKDAPSDDGRPSLAGSSSSRPAAATTPPKPKASQSKARSMTPDELKRAADALGNSMRATHERRMAAGPAVGFYSDPAAKREAFQSGVLYGESARSGKPDPLPEYMQPKPAGSNGGAKPLDRTGPKYARGIDPKAHGEKVKPPPGPSLPPPNADIGAREVERGRPSDVRVPQRGDKEERGGGPLAAIQQDANRRMAGFPYAYKDEFRPPEQAPGELNYGFSAQELEKNPITATAVRPDANGMRTIDVNKLVKTQAAGIASLQQQIDQMRGRRG
jgi:hypothetical protein